MRLGCNCSCGEFVEFTTEDDSKAAAKIMAAFKADHKRCVKPQTTAVVKEYCTAWAYSVSGRDKAVSELLLEGWQPWGSATLGVARSGTLYEQAMVRYGA